MDDPEINVTRTPTTADLSRFRDLMGSVREQRSEANAEAGEAREILKGLGFGSVSIAMYKRLTDMSDEIGPAVFEELLQLLDADPAFPYSTGKPNMFADAAVKATKGKGGGKAKGGAGAKQVDLEEAIATAPDKAAANGAAKPAKLGKGDAAGALAAAQQHLGTAPKVETKVLETAGDAA